MCAQVAHTEILLLLRHFIFGAALPTPIRDFLRTPDGPFRLDGRFNISEHVDNDPLSPDRLGRITLPEGVISVAKIASVKGDRRDLGQRREHYCP